MDISKIKELSIALEGAVAKKNTLTVQEFKEFHPLFKKSTDTNTTEYQNLCSKWGFRVSLFDTIRIVDPAQRNAVVKELPPMYNRVDRMSNETHPEMVVNKFSHAVAMSHPLRTDEEEALDIFKAALYYSQDGDRLSEAANKFAHLSDNAGFESDNGEASTTDKEILDQLEWD